MTNLPATWSQWTPLLSVFAHLSPQSSDFADTGAQYSLFVYQLSVQSFFAFDHPTILTHSIDEHVDATMKGPLEKETLFAVLKYIKLQRLVRWSYNLRGFSNDRIFHPVIISFPQAMYDHDQHFSYVCTVKVYSYHGLIHVCVVNCMCCVEPTSLSKLQ